MRNRIISAVVLVTIAIVSIGYIVSPTVKSTDTSNPVVDSQHVMGSVSSLKTLGYESKFGDLPNSLEGTLMRQALIQDEDGNLIVTPDLKRIFNYFLSTNEEEPVEVILLRIREYLAHYLTGSALVEAENILDQYIEYKQALVNLTASSGVGLDNMSDLLQQKRALRAQYMTDEISAIFYGQQDEFDDYTLGRLKILADTALSQAEKQEHLYNLEAATDPNLIASRKAAQSENSLRDQTKQMKSSGASDAEIYEHRVSQVGVEAALRLAELDKSRAQWQTRVDVYIQERQQILESEGLSQTDQESQIRDLREANFNKREQIRVRAQERAIDKN